MRRPPLSNIVRGIPWDLPRGVLPQPVRPQLVDFFDAQRKSSRELNIREREQEAVNVSLVEPLKPRIWVRPFGFCSWHERMAASKRENRIRSGRSLV